MWFYSDSGNNCKRAGDLLNVCLRKWGIYNQVTFALIKRKWEEIMPPVIKESTRLEGFRDGVLYIRTTSSVLRSEIRNNCGGLMNRLNNGFPDAPIKKIVVR